MTDPDMTDDDWKLVQFCIQSIIDDLSDDSSDCREGYHQLAHRLRIVEMNYRLVRAT